LGAIVSIRSIESAKTPDGDAIAGDEGQICVADLVEYFITEADPS
jgi:hypothetical protein